MRELLIGEIAFLLPLSVAWGLGVGCQQIEGKLAMSRYRWESRVSFGCHEGTEKVAKYDKKGIAPPSRKTKVTSFRKPLENGETRMNKGGGIDGTRTRDLRRDRPAL